MDQMGFDIIKDPLVREYMERKLKGQNAVKDAENTSEMIGYGSVLGQAAQDFANSDRKPLTLQNRFQELGSAPTMLKPEKVDLDFSGAQKMAQDGINRAKQNADQSMKDWSEGESFKSNRSMQLSDSPESVQARDYLKYLIPSAAKMPGFDQLSAAKINEIMPNLMASEKNKAAQAMEMQKLARQEEKDRRDQMFKENKFAQDLRKEIRGSKPAELYQTRRDSAINIADMVQNPGAYNDLGILFGYMKALDPGSVVREGEQMMFTRTGDITDRVANLFNRFVSGETLQPGQRQEILDAVERLHKRSYDSYRQSLAPVSQQAQEFDLDMSRIDPYSSYGPNDIPKAKVRENSPQIKAPHGQRVKQNGVNYIWNGSEYVPE